MVSKVFAPEQLPESALAFARRIAAVPTMAALLIKESVNQTVDTMGFHTALNACFTIHELNHAHWAWRHGADLPVAQPEDGISDWRSAPAIRPALKNHALAPDSVR
jgi:enoyl-CoA hydratase